MSDRHEQQQEQQQQPNNSIATGGHPNALFVAPVPRPIMMPICTPVTALFFFLLVQCLLVLTFGARERLYLNLSLACIQSYITETWSGGVERFIKQIFFSISSAFFEKCF